MSQSITTLFGRFFQFGYVTNDLEAGIAAFCRRFGATTFSRLSPPARLDGTASTIKHIGLAYIGETMMEIIEPDAEQPTIYDDVRLKLDGPLALHHLGYYVDEHHATIDRLNAIGYDVPVSGSMGEVLDYAYADTRADLGHYCEFIRLGPQGHQFYATIPRNSAPRTAGAGMVGCASPSK